MKTSSAKAKGRRAAAAFKHLMLKYAPDLPLQDISVTPSGVTGPDITFSDRAFQIYPFDIECKNQERLNFFKAMEQAESHRDKGIPLLIVTKNHKPLYVCMEAEEWLKLIR